MDKHFTYVCPHCKEEQTGVSESQKGVLFYEYDFVNESKEEKDAGGDEHIEFYCVLCGEVLPEELDREILKIINSKI